MPARAIMVLFLLIDINQIGEQTYSLGIAHVTGRLCYFNLVGLIYIIT